MNRGTRNQVKVLIRQGTVAVNEETVYDPEYQVEPEADRITCRGENLIYETFVYYMMNKPAGVVSATQDDQSRTVLDLLREGLMDQRNFDHRTFAGIGKNQIFPVGRLDKDTEGLLLLTNDGALAHDLLSPKKHVEKTYYVKIEKPLLPTDIRAMENGIDIGETEHTLPARVSVLSENEIHLSITEGRFHQVKRMLQAVDNQVLYLKRISMGRLMLDETLGKGQFRKLRPDELQLLK